MKIKQVTFTGADESVTPEQLTAIQNTHPFVEWGILISKSKEETPRFPGRKWQESLKEHAEQLSLSGHLCGVWMRDLVAGNPSYLEERPGMHLRFNRMQLNFPPGTLLPYNDAFFDLMRANHKQFIFQVAGVNNRLYFEARRHGVNAVPLHDGSGGRGKSPKKWPTLPPSSEYTGYAGGLGPDNLKDELRRIEDAAGDNVIWIDFETKVRSDDDKTFDLGAVQTCLEIVHPWTR